MALTTSKFVLNQAQASPILSTARQNSVIMALGTQEVLGLGGTNVPVFLDEPEAAFVGEAARKPIWDPDVTNKTMQVRKLALTVPVSAETARANPGGVIESLSPKIGGAFARGLDNYVLHGGVSGADYVDQTTKAVELGTATQANGGTYADINAGLKLLVDDDRDFTGAIFDNTAEPILNAAVDLNGRPLFVDTPLTDGNPVVRAGRILGRPAYQAKGLKGATTNLGYLGDFARIHWGVLTALSVTFSTEGTLVQSDGSVLSAVQDNLVIVVAEMEVGYVIADTADFVKLTNATA
ncbi:phage major capsid protein [Amycolatopsis acidicola]|uniref:phage major capsid protein n=1 Tax=Amycolatopsis acidicola TaxID=2596893 RepID=UPI001408B385|nr:phage major capsid protein [Amycolatopsis acidicola]